MGSKNAKAYLASPAVVAASAIAGYIDGPDEFESSHITGDFKINEKESTTEGETRIIDGFPDTISGELVFCHQDNLNSDGIFPGKYTYVDDFKREQQAEVVMENYDPEFGKIAKDGDILVGGYNFGTGSSREQAATALKYKGIRLVIAGSFSEIYKRNALNNGFLTIEVPELVNDLKNRHGIKKLTVKENIRAAVDFKRSAIEVNGKSYRISPVGGAAQEMIVVGGLENWVKENLE
jgi:homoaconitate hydratase